MHRLSNLRYERSLPVPDEPEETDLSQDDSRLSHLKLGTAWVSATLGGVGALTYASMTQTSPTTTMIALAVLLAAYAGYGVWLPKKHVIQFADSLYYMGFLWALFALLASFVIWPAEKLSTDMVLTTFGYALMATFSGMLLRLVIIHFQDPLPDRAVHAQESIDRRVAVLVRELNDATMEITSFRDRAATDLGGTLHDLVRSLADAREKIAEQQRMMANMMTERFEASLQEVLGRLSAIQLPQEILTSEVTKLVGMLGAQGQSFERAAHRLEKNLMHAAETVTAFSDSLYGSEAAKQVGIAINGLSDKIKERSEQFVHMTAALEKSRTELDGQLTGLQALRAAVATVSTQLTAFETELRDVSAASLSVEVRNGLSNVQQAISSTLEASKAIESTMRGVLFFMRDRVAEEHSGGRH